MLKIFNVNPKFEIDHIVKEIDLMLKEEEYQEVLNNFCLMAYSEKMLKLPFLEDLKPIAKTLSETIPKEILERNKESLDLAGFYDNNPKFEKELPTVEERVEDLFILWSEDASFNRWRCADT